MRIFAVSDLHVDHRPNQVLVEGLGREEYTGDALIVAGDIAHQLDTVATTLAGLRARFGRVFYVPGNHELWVGNSQETSVERFERILALCRQLQVDTQPARAGKYWIVPLFGWYESGFARGQYHYPAPNNWADFHFCRWPNGLGSPAAYFTGLNLANLRRYQGPVISFSHFLPRPDLLPPVERLRFKALPQVAGSARLEAQVRHLGSQIHIFGHSHILWDEEINGVRYLQHALAYPKERRRARPLLQRIG